MSVKQISVWLLLPVVAFLSVLALQLFIIATDIHIGDEDAAAYALQGQNIADGKGLVSDSVWIHFKPYDAVDHDEDYWPPLQSYLIAASLKLVGDNLFAVKLPSVIIFAGLVILVYLISARLFSQPAALLAAGMCMAAADLGLYAIGARNDLLFIALALACWYVSSLAWSDGRIAWRYVGLAGTLAGLAFLDRSVSVVLVPTFATWFALRLFLWRDASLLHRLKQLIISIALFTGCFIMVSSPYLARNLSVFGQPLADLNQGFVALALHEYQAAPEARSVDSDLSHYRGFREIYINRSTQVSYLSPGTLATVFHKAVHEAGIAAKMIKRSYIVPVWLLFLALISYAFVGERARYLLEIFLICVLGHLLMISLFSHTEQRYYVFMLPPVFIFSAYMLIEMSRCLASKGNASSMGGAWKSAWGGYWGIVTFFLIFSVLVPAGAFYAHAVDSRKVPDGTVAEGRWLSKHTPEGAVVMTAKPLRVAFYSRRPTVMLPLAEADMVCRLLDHYHVDYLVASNDYVKNLHASTAGVCQGMLFKEGTHIGRKVIFRVLRAGRGM